jgi:unsaturated chondroitin disaccharide hydrolase
MKNLLLTFVLFFALIKFSFAQKKAAIDVKKQFEIAAKQYEGMLASHPDTTQFPQSTKPDGSINNRKSNWWCSGFFGGSLWYLFEFTGDKKWKDAAHKWTMAVQNEKNNTKTHDLGFMMYCPFGNGYRLTKNPEYLEPMLTGANSLSTRFNPAYGLIKSWDHNICGYPVIIDNMMNLEYLFWATKQSKDKKFYDIAITHADNTMKNHFRSDYSSFHVVCYEPGPTVFRKQTHQGAADSSAWARGQAWALYGYTMMYRETKDKKYLAQAEGIAKFIMNHPNLPKDKVPYWDFNAPNIPNEERDASAGALFASSLLELSTYSTKNRKTYFDFAEQVLVSLSSDDYMAKVGENNNFILMHSVGNKPSKSEINTPIVYADYYYLEALLRYQQLMKYQQLKNEKAKK